MLVCVRHPSVIFLRNYGFERQLLNRILRMGVIA